MAADRGYPPVILVGVESPIGLAIVRELGRRGIEVHGLATSPAAIGLASRFLRRGYVRGGPLDLQLRTIAADSGAQFVMTVSMHDSIAVREAADRHALGSLRPLLPPLDKLHLVNDKFEICRIATTVGIATPQIWEPRHSGTNAIPDDLKFPLVLKWRDPELVYSALDALGIPTLKFEYVYSRDDLTSILERYRPIGRWPMVQSFAPGYGLGQMFLMHRGRALLRFQHRRIAEWPPEGGASTECESVALAENHGLMERSEELLRTIGWEGPAMVEYRYDPATDTATLMEINGRFWGSLPLASAAGIDFGWGTYAALGLDADPRQPNYRSGVRCRYMVPHTRRLLRILFRPDLIANRDLRFGRTRALASYVAGFLRPSGRYYVFSPFDPGPFIADLRGILAKAMRRVRLRMNRGGARSS